MRLALVLPIWALFIAACGLWGTHLNASGVDLRLNAPPLFGKLGPAARRLGPRPDRCGGRRRVGRSRRCAGERRGELLLALVALAALAWGIGLALIEPC